MATYTSPYQTQTAGTEIVAICPPNGTKIPVLRGLSYTAAATLHNAYFMSPLGKTTTSSFTAAADTTMELAKLDPGKSTAGEDEDLAASDWVLYQNRYGTIEARKVSSVSGSTLTFATGPTNAVDEGAPVWACYEAGRATNKQIRLTASVRTTLDNMHIQGGIPHQDGIEISVTGIGYPAMVVIDNATNAGFLEVASWTWVDSSEEFLK